MPKERAKHDIFQFVTVNHCQSLSADGMDRRSSRRKIDRIDLELLIRMLLARRKPASPGG
jgi:hypothetical protein